MTKRISQLPGVGGVADTDEVEINQSGVSRKATRGQLVAGLASAAHQYDLADIADAGALAALDAVGAAEIKAAAYASQSEAVAGTDNAKVMTALRTAEAIAAQAAARSISTPSPTSPMLAPWRRWTRSARRRSIPPPTPRSSMRPRASTAPGS